MFWRSLAAAFIAAAIPHWPGASAEECGGVHVVKRGDTISKISRLYYGDLDPSLIHSANRATIGPDPSLIEIGMELRIPCPGAALAAVAEASADPVADPRARDAVAAMLAEIARDAGPALARALSRGAVEFPAVWADCAAAPTPACEGRVLSDPFVEAPGGGALLAAAVPADHPRAAALAAEINRGLAALRRSGRWFAILHAHHAAAAEGQPSG